MILISNSDHKDYADLLTGVIAAYIFDEVMCVFNVLYPCNTVAELIANAWGF